MSSRTRESLPKFTCEEVARGAGLEGGIRSGNEILFRCPIHRDGQERHLSLSINPAKDTWICGPCRAENRPHAAGKGWKLAAHLTGIPADDKTRILEWAAAHHVIHSNGNGNHAGRRIIRETIHRYLTETG